MKSAFVVLPLLVAAGSAAADDVALAARLDWRSEGEIRQVWFHREFEGLLLPRAPLEVAGAAAAALLSGVSVACSAITKIGLPDWSTGSAICVLDRAGSRLGFEFECNGTQLRCEGPWRVIEASGDFAGITGSGRTFGYLVDPMPMPWFWNGPVLGYTELRGTLVTP
jgi:hypothetical protein